MQKLITILGVGLSCCRVLAADMTLGTVVTGAISVPGQQASYTFQGAIGQRLIYDALETGVASLSTRLVTPSGLVAGINQNSYTDVGPVTLLETGTYTLVVDGNGPATGTYSFRVMDVSQQPELQFGPVTSKSIDRGYGADIYRFQGSPGRAIYLHAQGAAVSSSYWALYGPNNEGLASASFNGDMEVVLKGQGTHVLVLFNNSGNPANYVFEALDESVGSEPLTLGAATAGTLAKAGDQYLYTFQGTAGQRLYYDALEADYSSIQVRLLAPGGANVFINGNSDGDVAPFSLQQSGVYTLQIDGNGATTGTYGFRLLDLASAAPIHLGDAVSGQLAPRSRAELYGFAGTAGQRVRVDSISSSGSDAVWQLIGPANQLLASASIQQSGSALVLPAAGVYVLVFNGTSANAVPLTYQFRVTDLSDPPVSVTGLGTVASGDIAAGQQETSTFTASAGTWIYFDSQDRSNQNLILELRDPENQVVYTIGTAADYGPTMLSKSGTYSVSLKGNTATATGSYRFRLLNMAAAPSLAFNTAIGAAPDAAYQTDVYQFTGATGQRFVYDALENDFENMSVRLWAPEASYRYLSGNSDSDVGPFTLGTAGIYYLFLESNQAGPTHYRFAMLNVADQPLLELGLPTSGTLDPGLGILAYRVSGQSGLHLFLNSTGSTSSGGTWYLFGANNEVLASANINGFLETTLTQTGTAVLVLAGNSLNPLPYAFTLLAPDTDQNGDQPRITQVSGGTGQVTLTWTASPGQAYRVQFKANLEDPTWTDLTGDVTAAGASATKSDATVGTAQRRFYRIQRL